MTSMEALRTLPVDKSPAATPPKGLADGISEQGSSAKNLQVEDSEDELVSDATARTEVATATSRLSAQWTGVRDEAHGDWHFERPVAVGVQNVVGVMGHECLVNLGS